MRVPKTTPVAGSLLAATPIVVYRGGPGASSPYFVDLLRRKTHPMDFCPGKFPHFHDMTFTLRIAVNSFRPNAFPQRHISNAIFARLYILFARVLSRRTIHVDFLLGRWRKKALTEHMQKLVKCRQCVYVVCQTDHHSLAYTPPPTTFDTRRAASGPLYKVTTSVINSSEKCFVRATCFLLHFALRERESQCVYYYLQGQLPFYTI